MICALLFQYLIDKVIAFGDFNHDQTVLAKVVEEKKILKVTELLPKRPITQEVHAGFLAVSKDFNGSSIDFERSAGGTDWLHNTKLKKTRLKDFGAVILEDELYVLGGHDEYLRAVHSVGCILFSNNHYYNRKAASSCVTFISAS